MQRTFKWVSFFLALSGLIFAAAQILPSAYADSSSTATTASSSTQAAIDTNNQQIANLNQQIAAYEIALKQVGADKKTLTAAINTLDLQRKKIEAQSAVTQHKITVTQLQIIQLGGQITDTKQTITTEQAALADELKNLQKADARPALIQMLSTGSFIQTWSDLAASLQFKDSIQNKMQALQSQENNLASSQTASQQKKDTLGTQQQALVAQQQTLSQTVATKNELLTETNAKESTYEKLLAAAKAQLASFSTFAQNAGGSKLIGNQTVCDSWGCYYNQRDSAWGNDALNGTQYRLASDGCLVTSMAMVMTHYGYKDVTPVTINSNPANFATYYPAYLLITINVDGVSATRKSASIDATLASGDPIVVGLHAYGGTHYVVLISGNKGNYLMRDPYISNGKDISFTAHYSLRSIFAISKVQIS